MRFGPTKDYGREVHVPGRRTLHHVEIPLPSRAPPSTTRCPPGTRPRPSYTFKGYPADVLRVAVVANWQGKPDLKSPWPGTTRTCS